MGAGALREIFASFGFSFDTKELDKGNKSIEGMLDAVKGFGAALAGTAVVGAVREFTDAILEQAGALGNASSQLGMTTDEYQALAYAANQADVGAEQFSASMATLARNSVSARTGSGGAATAFRALGVNLRNTDGSVRSTGDLFRDLAHGLGEIEDPARRGALAQQLMGEQGRRLLPIMQDGAGGVEAYAREFGELGGGLSADAIEAAGALEEQQKRLNVVWDSARSQLATALLPILTWLVTKVREVGVAIQNFTRNTNLVKAALAVLGTAALIAGGKMALAGLKALLPWLPLMAAVALLILVVEDLWTLIEGGDSVIGQLIDRIYGAGQSAHFLDDLKQVWGAIKEGVESAKAAIIDFGGQAGTVFSDVADGWRDLMTEFPIIEEVATGVWDVLKWMFNPIGEAMAQWPAFGEAMRSVFQTVTDAIAGMLRAMFNPVGAGINMVKRALQALGLAQTDEQRQQADDQRQRESTRAAMRRQAAANTDGSVRGNLALYQADASRAAANRANGTQTVSVHAGTTTSRTTVTTNAPVIHVHGTTDPEAAGRAAAREVERQQRARRDADHPVSGG